MKKHLIALLLLVLSSSSVFAASILQPSKFNFNLTQLKQLGLKELIAVFSTQSWSSGWFALTNNPTVSIGIGSVPLTGVTLWGDGDDKNVHILQFTSDNTSCAIVGQYLPGAYNVNLSAKLVSHDSLIYNYKIYCRITN